MTETKTAEAPAPVKEAETNGRDLNGEITKVDITALAGVRVGRDIDLVTASKLVAESGIFPDIKRAAQAGVKILKGRELGLDIMTSVEHIYWIDFTKKNGVRESRLVVSAEARGALIKRSGNYDYLPLEYDYEHCKIEFFGKHRVTGEWVSLGISEYSIADAKKMGTAERENWQKDPRSMVLWGALRRGQKMYCPELTVAFHDDFAETEALARVVESELADTVVDAELVDEGSDAQPTPADASTEGESGAEPVSAPGSAEAVTQQKAEGGAEDASASAATDTGEDADAPGGDGEGASQATTEGRAVNAADEQTEPSVPEASGNTRTSDGEPGLPPSDSLFGSTPSGAGTPPLTFGPITVPPAPGGPHDPAMDTGERVASKRVKELEALMQYVDLPADALDAVFMARYGFVAKEAKKSQADAFEEFIRLQAQIVAARKASTSA